MIVSNRNYLTMIVLLTGIALLSGCGKREPVAPPQAVMFDKATQTSIVAPAVSEYPAIHPQTGKPTLMPAMYCSKCSAWRPVPPPEEVNRMKGTLTCSKCRGPLVPTGPMPGETP